jgi:glyoxylase-like metal-dependent hydrolase (beta-lactamase superfamily II)
MFFQKFPSGPLQTNAVLVGCNETKKALVIDPAFESSEEILAVARDQGLQIEAILLTHSHWDHIADVDALKRSTQALVYVHSLDAGNLENPGSDKIPLFFPILGTRPDRFLEEGQRIRVGHLEFAVLHTPGHSPGSVCFYLEQNAILFSGDTLFRGSIGALHLPTAEPTKMWGSLRKLAALPPSTHVVPGHGPDTTLADESWLERAEQIFRN